MVKKEIVFATHNHNKAEEIRELLGDLYHVRTLDEIGLTEDIPETADTLQGNALIKAKYVFDKTGKTTFADDTGLEVDALQGEPGVFSARYAGPQKNSEDNMKKLLNELDDKDHRSAQFRTSICLIEDGEEQYFEGIVRGNIAEAKKGEKGFGYDPIFIPENHERSFAEMTSEEKNTMSHRARAIQALIGY